MCGRFMRLCRKKISVVSRPSRPDDWDAAGSSTSPRCWNARDEPLNGEFTNSTICRTILRPVVCGGPAAVEKKVQTEPQLQENLRSVLEVHTAGDPDDAEALWTDLSPRAIAETVTDLGTPVSPGVVRDWLEAEGLSLHKIEKTIAGGRKLRYNGRERNRQWFLMIAALYNMIRIVDLDTKTA